MMGGMSMGGNMMDGMRMRLDGKDEKVRSLHINLLSPPPLNYNF